MNYDKDMKEPEGFKGTKGKFHAVKYAGIFMIQNGPYYGNKDILCRDNTKDETEYLANAQLLQTSKKLLIALEPFKKFADAYSQSNKLTDKDHALISFNEVDITVNNLKNCIKAVNEALT